MLPVVRRPAKVMLPVLRRPAKVMLPVVRRPAKVMLPVVRSTSGRPHVIRETAKCVAGIIRFVIPVVFNELIRVELIF